MPDSPSGTVDVGEACTIELVDVDRTAVPVKATGDVVNAIPSLNAFILRQYPPHFL